jgi:hypothetical protein
VHTVVLRRTCCTSYPVDTHRTDAIAYRHEAQSLRRLPSADTPRLPRGIRYVLDGARIAQDRSFAGRSSILAAISGGVRTPGLDSREHAPVRMRIYASRGRSNFSGSHAPRSLATRSADLFAIQKCLVKYLLAGSPWFSSKWTFPGRAIKLVVLCAQPIHTR